MYVHISILHQKEHVVVTLRNRTSESNAICEIYAAAILLKTKLKQYPLYQENTSANAIHLFESAITYLDHIADIQWELYVRNYYNLYVYLLIITIFCL